MKKSLGLTFMLLSFVGSGLWIWAFVHADYEWNNQVLSNWSLSDKSSNLAAKADYMGKFVSALQSTNLADNDALLYKTADNSCPNNIEAVTTLKQRLDQIKGMDEGSLQYQQAISQITAQEQGESTTLISTLNGCYMKANHYFLWNGWINALTFFVLLIMFGLGLGGLLSDN